MIWVRDDDVLLPSKGGKDSLARFKGVHELICSNTRFLHVPAILVKEIQTVPGAVEYVKQETAAGRMRPELHGYEHIDYGAMDIRDILEHLSYSKRWMHENLGVWPTKWYTPWGASQDHLREASKIQGLQMVDCSSRIKLRGEGGATDLLQKHRSLDVFEGQELAMHWWCGVDRERLKQVVEFK
jgi:hypothetical protein